jgi:hypothetical protein
VKDEKLERIKKIESPEEGSKSLKGLRRSRGSRGLPRRALLLSTKETEGTYIMEHSITIEEAFDRPEFATGNARMAGFDE